MPVASGWSDGGPRWELTATCVSPGSAPTLLALPTATGTHRTGLDRITDHLEPVSATVMLLRIDDQLRLFLSAREVAVICGVDYQRVLGWIESGLIEHARDALGTQHYPIPVRELAKLQGLTTRGS